MALVQVVGGGLAGCEAAFQAAQAGADVILHEMRPHSRTAAHKTDAFGELVCSNSLKSEQVHSAPWLLKQEMRALDSLLMRAAQVARVPGGHALTVDREVFSAQIAGVLEAHPRIEIRRGEVTAIPEEGVVVIASGPLTSDALAEDISRVTGSERLYFYDSISPIVAADSIDMSVAFRASRWGKSLDGSDDYINCPFTKEQYSAFIDELLKAEFYEAHIPEDKTPYFEGCLPVEEIARRGRDTLRFGPMKPAGLDNPATGRWAYAIVQLRQENQRADSYNLVGFQNHMRFGDQARVLRLIPGLEKGGISALRPDAPEYVYQFTVFAGADVAAQDRRTSSIRRPDFGRGRLCRIHCYRLDGRKECGATGGRPNSTGVPARDGDG